MRTPNVVDENKSYPIYLYYYYGGKQIRESTSICTRVADWNQDRGELRASYGQDYKKRNDYLQKLLLKVDNCIFEYVEKNGRITPATIKSFITGDFTELRADSGQTFLDYARMQLEKKYKNKKVRISTYMNDVTNINQFEKYLASKSHDAYSTKKKSIFVGDIDEDIVRDFLCWGLDRGRKKDTVEKYLETINKICKCAYEQGYLSHDKTQAIADIGLTQELDEDDQDIKYLTASELGKLVHIDKTKLTDKQAMALELFLFAFYACGLRVSDVISLRWHDVDLEKKEINKIQVKTRGRNTIPLCSEAVEILERWKGKHKVFVFGLLPDDFEGLNDEVQFRMRRNCITSGLNRKLKRIAEVAQLDQKVTCHVARHSFAVNALEQGMSINMISTLLGHSSTLITEKVYAIFMKSTKAEAVNKLKFTF